MYVATARITLHLLSSGSLKDKRQVVRSVLARARNQFEVAAAEVDSQEVWNLAVIGVACVSGDGGHALGMVERVIRSIEASRPDVEVTEATTDVLTVE